MKTKNIIKSLEEKYLRKYKSGDIVEAKILHAAYLLLSSTKQDSRDVELKMLSEAVSMTEGAAYDVIAESMSDIINENTKQIYPPKDRMPN